jgi:hypothetical protein
MKMPIEDTVRHQQVIDELEKSLRPSECHRCWAAEDVGAESWREIGNKQYLAGQKDNDNFMIEVTLDNTCDLSCSYCGAGCSNTWEKEFKNAPEWAGKVHGLGNSSGNAKEDFIKKTLVEEIVRIIKLKKNIFFNIYGGETFLSPFLLNGGLEYLVESYYSNGGNNSIHIALTTNGNTPEVLAKKYIERYEKLQECYPISFNILISNEASGSTAEFIRYGLDYNNFLKISKLWLNSKFKEVHPLMTINALAITSLTNFIEDFTRLFEETNRRKVVILNPVYDPVEQSISVLDHRFEKYLNEFSSVLKQYNYTMYSADVDKLKNLLGTNTKQKHKLKTFIDYSRIVRNVDFSQIEPEIVEYLEEE